MVEASMSLGPWSLQCGVTLPDAQLRYVTHGTLNEARDNAILHPTWFAGRDRDAFLIGEGRALDPRRYFIIVPNLFGNGLSSSPSNTRRPWNAGHFPLVSLYDNVMAQHRLVTEELGVEHLRLVTGYSMGALQTFQWGCLFPDLMDAIVPTCGAARCSPHNLLMIDGISAALRADGAFCGGDYREPPTVGIRAAARNYAAWGFSQAFFREGAYRDAGYASLEDYCVNLWEAFLLSHDANDLLAMFATWRDGDISNNPVFEGNFENALGAIRARAIVMPGRTDLYFPPEDSEYEVKHMPNAELRPFESIYGHFAASWLHPPDVAFHEAALREALGD